MAMNRFSRGIAAALVAGVVTLGVSHAAQAQPFTFELDDLVLSNAGASVVQTIEITEDVIITGFTFTGTFSTSTGALPSDTRFTIESPGGDTLSYGDTFDPVTPDHLWFVDHQTSDPDPPTISSSHAYPTDFMSVPGEGVWTLTFHHAPDFFGADGSATWTDPSITLVPEPGSLALLGVSGLLLLRRRNRDRVCLN